MTGDIKYLRLQDVRKGMQFYEEDGGRAVLCEATEDAHEINENGKHGWQCIAKVISGDSAMVDEDGMVTLFECYNPGGYGLNLYQQIDASKPPATTVTTCHKCKQPMTMTPVCTACGIIPIATGSFEQLQLEIDRLKAEMAARYAVEEVMQQVQEAAKNLDAAPFTKAAFVKTIRERLANQRKEKS